MDGQPVDDVWRPKVERDRVKGRTYDALKARPKFACLYPQASPCTERVIDSHSVQKSPILRPLADASNHVYMFQGDLVLDDPPLGNPPPPKLKRIGVNEATTFRGLCAAHDTELFKPIEQHPFDPANVEHCFLAAYRSVLMEMHRKRVTQAQTGAIARSTSEDPGAHPWAKQIAVYAALAHARGEAWITELKEQFDRAYLKRDFTSGLSHWGVTLPKEVSFALTSCFTPLFDLEGHRIQIMRPDRRPAWISLTILPRDGATAIALTSKSPTATRRIASALRSAGPNDLEILLSHLALANVENIAFAPSWWDSLTEQRRAAITTFFAKTVFAGAPFPGNDANLFH